MLKGTGCQVHEDNGQPRPQEYSGTSNMEVGVPSVLLTGTSQVTFISTGIFGQM